MKKNNNINFRDRNLFFVDLETTGLDLDSHEILEIGCLLVDCKDLNILDQYQVRIKPEHIQTASEEGLKVAGYSEEIWAKDAIPLEKALMHIAKMGSNALVAGWKVDFDWSFLQKAFNKYHIEHSFDYHMVDVISLGYAYFRNKDKPDVLGLRKVAAALNIEMNEQHDALGDIKGTYLVFKKLFEIFNPIEHVEKNK